MGVEAVVIPALLLMALAPSLLPNWRHALIAAACLQSLAVLGFLATLQHFDRTSAEGPAFVGLVLLTGALTFIMASSLGVRTIIGLAVSRLALTNAVRLRRMLIATGLSFGALALLGVLHFSVQRGFATMVGAASIWLVVVTWLTPAESSGSLPLRGTA